MHSGRGKVPSLLLFFFSLVTCPRRSLSLELSDTRVPHPNKHTSLKIHGAWTFFLALVPATDVLSPTLTNKTHGVAYLQMLGCMDIFRVLTLNGPASPPRYNTCAVALPVAGGALHLSSPKMSDTNVYQP